MTPMDNERLVQESVTYTLFKEDKLYLIEHVPARVDLETGGQFFAPDTVERLQKILWDELPPGRTVHTVVYEFGT